MILNIYGPSGSGKTTFARKLIEFYSVQEFFEKYSKTKIKENLNKNISISLLPLPMFRGSLKQLFDIYNIDIFSLLNLNIELTHLSKSIFNESLNIESIDLISRRQFQTFSAGEMRRIFILKSLLVEASLTIIDEPFSNSDKKLWDIICKAISIKSRTIILSHLSLDNFFQLEKDFVSININDINNKY